MASVADILNGTNGTGSTGRSSDTTRPKDQLGQAEFLELMIAQLKNQDPFKAMDPSQFLGQLAQFGTVSGIEEVKGALTTLSDSMRSSQVLDGATMVGREVLVASEDASLSAEGAITGAIEVPKNATSVELTVRDSSGALVRRMTLPTTSGLQEFSWDGMSNSGTRAAAGNYSFECVASVGGQTGSLETMMSSRVSSVTIDATHGLTLNTTNLGARALSDVRRVM